MFRGDFMVGCNPISQSRERERADLNVINKWKIKAKQCDKAFVARAKKTIITTTIRTMLIKHFLLSSLAKKHDRKRGLK